VVDAANHDSDVSPEGPPAGTFGERLRLLRLTAALTQADAARLVTVTERTWIRWEAGQAAPAASKQTEVLERLDATSNGLYFEKHKGWLFRVTIERGPKVVGIRKKFKLGTRDLAEALRHRALVLSTLRRLGLTVKPRPQRRKGFGVSHRAREQRAVEVGAERVSAGYVVPPDNVDAS